MKTYSLISLIEKTVFIKEDRETKRGKEYTQILERKQLQGGKPIHIGRGDLVSVTFYQGTDSNDKAVYNGSFYDFNTFNGVQYVSLKVGDLIKTIKYCDLLKFIVIRGGAVMIKLSSLPVNMPEYKATGSNPVRGVYRKEGKKRNVIPVSVDHKVKPEMINRGGINFNDKAAKENDCLKVSAAQREKIQEAQAIAAKEEAEKLRREAQALHDKTVNDAHCRLRKTLINACKVKK